MTKLNLPYDRYAYPLVIGFVGSVKSVSSFFPTNCDTLVFDFGEYIKSQVHLNVERPFFGSARDLELYVNASKNYDYGQKNGVLLQVYNYFLQDIENFLVKWQCPLENFKVELVCGFESDEVLYLTEESVNQFDNNFKDIDKFAVSEDAWIVSHVDSFQAFDKKRNLLYLASVLHKYRNTTKFIDFVWR